CVELSDRPDCHASNATDIPCPSRHNDLRRTAPADTPRTVLPRGLRVNPKSRQRNQQPDAPRIGDDCLIRPVSASLELAVLGPHEHRLKHLHLDGWPNAVQDCNGLTTPSE